MGRHYVEGDLVMSHIVSCLSAVFPEGEDFFVRSVRHYRDQIDDPELAEQVAGFIGQEVTHGREHRALNERLQAMGYPTRFVDRRTKYGLAFAHRVLSPQTQLAITAALEHYTATLAECLLTKPEAQALLGGNEVRSMLLWHALEESEHKTVAFDVYRAIGGGERRRINTMRVMTVMFLGSSVLNTILSLALDRASYHPVRLVRSVANLRHSPFLARDVRQTLRAYNRVGFHPDDIDSDPLLDRWRTELFGVDGALTDHLK
ncbi:MAG: metal-dependent hydrolase [Actinomycetota bacterium]|nr:metal-dependent hydrolase [Actinomycetota bacterium]